jgi:FkbM family methyltransferase
MDFLSKLLLHFRLLKYSYGFGFLKGFIHNNSLLSTGLKYLKRGDTAIDIGANNGGSSLLLSALVGKSGFVYSFEPNAAIAKQLLSYVDLNYFNNITAFLFGIGCSNSVQKFYVDCRNGSEASTFEPHHRESEITHNKASFDEILVEIRTLDSFNFSRVDFIKIDVEGFELEALVGSLNTIKKFNPVIYFECFFDDNIPNLLDKKLSLSKLFNELHYTLDIIECFTSHDFSPTTGINLSHLSVNKHTGFEILARPNSN